MSFFENIKKQIHENKKIFFFVLFGFIGILLLTFSNSYSSNAKVSDKECSFQTKASDSVEYVQNLESHLEKILNETEGVGRCKVFLTLESSDEKIYAKDQKSNAKQKEDTYEQITDSKFVRPDRQSGKEGVIVKINAPKIKGVLIVCDGGNNAELIQKLTLSIAGTLGVSPNAIHIMKMKN